MTTTPRARRAARTAVTTSTVVALALAGVVLPTVSLPVPKAHAVAPDVEDVLVRGIDPDARQEKGALDDAVGHEHDAAAETAGDTAAVEGAETLSDVPAPEPDEGALAALSERTTTQDFMVAGVTWDEASTATVTEVAVRVRESGTWSEWQSLGIDDTDVAGGRAGTEPLVTAGADGVQARVRTDSGAPPTGLKVDVVDPGTSRADASVGQESAPAASADAGTGTEIRPKIVSRSGWGADESLSGRWPELSGKLKAIYIHHTAGTNSYKESQSAALVRGVYAYHTKSRGWPDIGYQFLVDKFGNIFEGRKKSRWDNPVGAQAGGYNTGTIGISAMGSFDTAQPSSALVTALARVVAWKSYTYGINPRGTVVLPTGGSTGSGTRAKPGTDVRVPTVLMHRTTNLTACPGQYLAAKMGTIRAGADSRRDAAIKKYGSIVPKVKAPTRVDPTSNQVPVQWNGRSTYRWKPVSGAVSYQVLQRYAKWNEGMPYTYYWREVKLTSATSITLSQSTGQSRELAVRAVDSDHRRGPLTSLARTNRAVSPSSWKRSSGWKKVTSSSYFGDYAYRTTTKGAYVQLPGAKQVRRVVIRGATSPSDGRLQVRVGGKAIETLDFGRASDGDRIFTVWVPRTSGTVTLKTLDSGKPVRISKIAVARW
ncbi:peptidoglycan recognition protein [Isoptericola sp. NPDC056605]|uniref:peptidoglycan recognition protein family protein n=1 Tax=unclassified Isoptericola TaxID=2623355 RepID=UPI0036A73D53